MVNLVQVQDSKLRCFVARITTSVRNKFFMLQNVDAVSTFWNMKQNIATCNATLLHDKW